MKHLEYLRMIMDDLTLLHTRKDPNPKGKPQKQFQVQRFEPNRTVERTPKDAERAPKDAEQRKVRRQRTSEQPTFLPLDTRPERRKLLQRLGVCKFRLITCHHQEGAATTSPRNLWGGQSVEFINGELAEAIGSRTGRLPRSRRRSDEVTKLLPGSDEHSALRPGVAIATGAPYTPYGKSPSQNPEL